MDKFYGLPSRLKNKILPPKKLKPIDEARKLALEASIFPVHLKTAESAKRTATRYEEQVAQDGGCPPITNRGGKSGGQTLPSFESLEFLEIVPLGARGKYQLVATPRPDKSRSVRHSFIDWVNFTFKVDQMPLYLDTHLPVTFDFDYVVSLSAVLFDVFGYGVTGQRESGMNFYKSSFNLGHNGWGLVCIGGQNGSCSVTVKGQGLLAAKPGWEQRLYDLLKTIPGSKLTRVDLANDNFNSKVSMDDYLAMYKADLFTSRGRPPNVEQLGNWITPNGKGRTLYIGNRKSGKLLRIYEKGLQLANGFHEKFPNWLRVELELKNQDRVIPFDVLLRPGQYLAGAYPALVNMHKVQETIKTAKKTVQSTFEKSLATVRHQYGKHIWTHVQILGVEKALEALTTGKEELPKLLKFDTHAQFDELSYLHTQHFLPTPLKEMLL
ncbi:DNA relaxase NicK [Methylobacter tundripaludum]|uniref:DNA relaxase NicK n=1 Tax=Methylobacter tundripaludum TaxID=173365 RepID=A0A2S6H333_9GAMM|nr:replication initiation factor domain-containing protein [Methylobacter tundripaludum]PPK71895.1 DNA relaxase NicK [Methylobacter tundripaludum]